MMTKSFRFIYGVLRTIVDPGLTRLPRNGGRLVGDQGSQPR